jgi:hypothetical protein
MTRSVYSTGDNLPASYNTSASTNSNAAAPVKSSKSRHKAARSAPTTIYPYSTRATPTYIVYKQRQNKTNSHRQTRRNKNHIFSLDTSREFRNQES